jgi:hypothetical protein
MSRQASRHIGRQPRVLPATAGVRGWVMGAGRGRSSHRDHASTGDLAVTADIPLAATLASRVGGCPDFRGDVYTEENVRERLSLVTSRHCDSGSGWAGALWRQGQAGCARSDASPLSGSKRSRPVIL